MALITCPECGKKISDKAEACIGCGYPINTHKKHSDILKDGVAQYELFKKNLDEIDKLVYCNDINNRNEQFLSHISFPLPFYF